MECSYELPIAHWATVSRLLAEEARDTLNWEPTLESTREPEEKNFKKRRRIKLADRITCPSKFVMDSIPKKSQKHHAKSSPFGSPPSEPVRF